MADAWNELLACLAEATIWLAAELLGLALLLRALTAVCLATPPLAMFACLLSIHGIWMLLYKDALVKYAVDIGVCYVNYAWAWLQQYLASCGPG